MYSWYTLLKSPFWQYVFLAAVMWHNSSRTDMRSRCTYFALKKFAKTSCSRAPVSRPRNHILVTHSNSQSELSSPNCQTLMTYAGSDTSNITAPNRCTVKEPSQFSSTASQRTADFIKMKAFLFKVLFLSQTVLQTAFKLTWLGSWWIMT